MRAPSRASRFLRSQIALVFSTILASCAAAPNASAPLTSAKSIAKTELPGSDGRAHAILGESSDLTVIEFFSAHCPCQAAHDPRLRDLAGAYTARGVSFYAVDSEVDANVDRERDEAQKRSYPYPILVDHGGALARALGADYATFSVVVDRDGHVLYSGGVDSDKSHLTGDAVSYLRDALDDALAKRPLRRTEAKTLGCALTLQ